jgi:hypothetical protein
LRAAAEVENSNLKVHCRCPLPSVMLAGVALRGYKPTGGRLTPVLSEVTWLPDHENGLGRAAPAPERERGQIRTPIEGQNRYEIREINTPTSISSGNSALHTGARFDRFPPRTEVRIWCTSLPGQGCLTVSRDLLC